MTSAQGTVTSCGPGQDYVLQYTCTGPSCVDLNGFPGTTCTTDGDTLTCSNGVTCGGPTNYTSTFSFNQSDIVVSQNQQIILSDFCEEIDLTSDGTVQGTTANYVDTGDCGPGSGSASSSSTSLSTTATSSSTSLSTTATSSSSSTGSSSSSTWTSTSVSPSTSSHSYWTSTSIYGLGSSSTSKYSQTTPTTTENSWTTENWPEQPSSSPAQTWNSPNTSSGWPDSVYSPVHSSSTTADATHPSQWDEWYEPSSTGDVDTNSWTDPAWDPKPTGTEIDNTVPWGESAGPTSTQSGPAEPWSATSSPSETSPWSGPTQSTSSSSEQATSWDNTSNWSSNTATLGGAPSPTNAAWSAWSSSESPPTTSVIPSWSPLTASATGSTNVTSAWAPYSNGAGRKCNVPTIWVSVILIFGLLVQGTLASVDFSSNHRAPADLTVHRRHAAPILEAANGTQHALVDRALTPGWKQFSDDFSEYLAGKITNGGEFAENLVDEVADAVCTHVTGQVVTKALGVDLVETCVDAVLTGALLGGPETEFLAIFGRQRVV